MLGLIKSSKEVAELNSKLPKLTDTHLGTAETKYNSERLEIEPKILEKIQKELIGKFKGYDIYLVNGTEIRNWVDPDWIGGGNSSRYKYIPEPEVWIESSTEDDDLIPYIVHEQAEAESMKQDQKTYEQAHTLATEKEWTIRHDPKARQEALKLFKQN